MTSGGGAIDAETGETAIEGSAAVAVTDRFGEVNDLTVRVESSVVVVTDRAAPLTHGPRCADGPGGSVRCPLPDVEEIEVAVAPVPGTTPSA